MKHVHRYFRRGRITDGDSSDIPGDALSECINMDLDVGIGQIRVRPGLELYSDLGDLPIFDEDSYPSVPAPPNGGVWWVYDEVLWDSGIATVQHNAMLVFREKYQGSWKDQYIVFSNAPEGGQGNTFTLLTTAVLAVPVCRPEPEGGMVRVALGNQTDSMIHLNLCEEGDRVLPTMTITATTDRSSEAIGAGGVVFKGWLWDWNKLYWSGASSGEYILGNSAHITVGWASASIVGKPPIEKSGFVVGIVPVYDINEVQYSIALFGTVDGSVWGSGGSGGQGGLDAVLALTFNITNETYNKRITGFAIYVQLVDRINHLDDSEASRIMIIPVTDLTGGSTTIYLDGDNMKNVESTWSADSKGRPLTLDVKSGVYGNGWSLVRPTTAMVDDQISVKPSGFMLRRKRMFAWGIGGDPGQSKFALSMQDTNNSAQLDVFWKLNRIWRDGSKETMWAVEWRDRMFLWNRNNSYWIDLEHRLDDQVMTLDTGFGIGTSLVRTIKKGGGALFWCNRDSAWRFTAGRPQDLMYEKMRDEWHEIPDSYKDDAVAGYYNGREEYWVCVQTSANEYTVYIWADNPQMQNWRCYRFLWDRTNAKTEFIPMGFFNEVDNKFVLFGQFASSGNPVMLLFNETNKIDVNNPIEFQLDSQWIGVRSDESVVDSVDLQRKRAGDMVALSVDFYANRGTTVVDTVVFPNERTNLAPVYPIRGQEYKLSIRGAYQVSGYTRPTIYEISVGSEDDLKRSE